PHDPPCRTAHESQSVRSCRSGEAPPDHTSATPTYPATQTASHPERPAATHPAPTHNQQPDPPQAPHTSYRRDAERPEAWAPDCRSARRRSKSLNPVLCTSRPDEATSPDNSASSAKIARY